MYVAPDPTCVEDSPCPEWPGFWVRRERVSSVAADAYCLLVLQKDKPPSPESPGWHEYPLPVTICKTTKAVQLDGVTLALKP